MTTAADIWFFCLIVAGLIFIILDYVTTSIGLGCGLIEANPVNKWLFAKIGQALTTFIEATLYLFLGGLMLFLSVKMAFIFVIAVLITEIVMVLRNGKLIGWKV
jgi:hypothetical protein